MVYNNQGIYNKNALVRFAVQKDGRLTGGTLSLLRYVGIEAEFGRSVFECVDHSLELLFVRDDDIPNLVESGFADVGVVGENIYREKNCKCSILLPLEFGQCSLVLSVPVNSNINALSDLEGKKVATSHKNSAIRFLDKMKINNVSIVSMTGAAEIAPLIGYADAIIDITSTGNSLKLNDLRQVHILYESQSVLIGNDNCDNKNKQLIIDSLIKKFKMYLNLCKH